ncbi:hypothetical protein [Erysipelothrix sp. P66]|uniref:hypothetical protein n=1 Tax=Erysipelothrix sp. P66 TaxID=3141531 RepID=UPI00315CCD5B
MSHHQQNQNDHSETLSTHEKTQTFLPSESNKNRTRCVIILLILGFISVGGYFLWDHIYRITKIDPFANVSVRFQGDEEGASGYIDINKKLIESDPQLNRVHKAIKYSLEPNENLKIGDRVVLKARVPESTQRFMDSNKLVFTATEKVFTVQEIHNEVVFDPFDGFKLRFSGTNGEGIAELDTSGVTLADDTMKELFSMLEYAIVNPSELSIGDSVTVTVKPSTAGKTFMLEHQIMLAQTSMAFDVDALAVVPKNIEHINNLDVLRSDAKKRVEETVNADAQEVYVCYGILPKNIANARDRDSQQSYVNGTLMFVYQYEHKHKAYAIASGYTNLMLEGDQIDESMLMPMQPVSNQQSLENVLLELQDNNLTCSPTS